MNPKLCLVIGILCISFSPILVKLADAPPVVSAFYRLLMAWVVLAPYVVLKGKLAIQRKDLLLALLGGLIFASDIAVWNTSLILISATVSTLVANLAPLWVGLLSYLIWQKKSGPLFWIGTGIAIAGMVVLVGFANLVQLHLNIGLILALVASLLYAMYILITKNILQRIHTLTFMFYSMLSGVIFLFVFCSFRNENLLHYTPATWFYFVVMGILCQLTGWVTINYAIMHLEATKVSIALLSQTVIAGILATFLLNEILDLKEIVGSIIVLVGIAVTFLKRRPINNL